jgi:hypothetical protein
VGWHKRTQRLPQCSNWDKQVKWGLTPYKLD